ncbi:LysR family transcriptional regulator [Pelotomaculum propionicicum]|uniref:HTH-type transcriptional regulator GltC n=1 Tax=Pelotomaculum propionicicum TaxID=258475 RepID=A0A4Y7RVS0_9FIRM|nr:LysR family transcriptional regulator [Pelotomaculum propionicicum]TEB12367.1 HTH-type transcriptional regulator GltC [Pelotomaculum propionicicum]
MRLEQLEIFVEVSNSNSMSMAGEKLHISQQAISKSIKSLETELNTQLFKRTKSGIFLTSTGENIYQDVKRIIEIYNNIKQRTNIQPESHEINLSGTLSIYIPIPLSPLITKLTQIIAQAHPHIKFSLIEQYPKDLNDSAQDISDEICIRTVLSNQIQYVINKSTNCNIYLLKEEKIHLYAHKKSLIARKKQISLKDLNNIPVVYHISPITKKCFISDLFELNGIPFNPILSSTQFNHCISYLKSNKACYFSSPIAMDLLDIEKDVVAIPLKGNYTWCHIMLTAKEPNLSNEARVFINVTQEHFHDSFCQISD